MESATLLSQGVSLLTYGMGTVFVFLTLLVIATTLMSKVLTRFLPEPEPVAVMPTAPAKASGAVDARTLAVIKAAIAQHRGQ